MVGFFEGLQDIALFCPGRSLILQLAEWCQKHRMFALRLVPTRLPYVIQPVLGAAVFCVVDATEEPQEAVGLLERGLEQVGRERIGVYSEIMHDGLETLVRTWGVPFWLGPMRQEEWEAAFSVLEPAAAAEVPRRRIVGQRDQSI